MVLATDLAPKFVGAASIIGSTYIIYSLVGTGQRQEKMKTTFHRFLMILSVFDIISSFGFFLSTWAVPREPPEGMKEAVDPSIFDYGAEFPLAAGTKGSCTFQGVICHMGATGSALFTGFISLQYVFSVRYQWSERSMRRMEKCCYTFGVLYPLVSSVYLAFTNQLHVNIAGFCWIGQYPIVCSDFYYEQDGSIEAWCIENEQFSSEQTSRSQLIFAYSIVGSVLITIIISMVLLFRTIRAQEKRASRWSINAQSGRFQKKTIQRAILLIGNHLVIYIPAMSIDLARIHTDAGNFAMVVLLSSQGILNALVYSQSAEKCLASFPSLQCCWGQQVEFPAVQKTTQILNRSAVSGGTKHSTELAARDETERTDTQRSSISDCRAPLDTEA